MELNQNELLILDYLWSQDEPQGFSSILAHYNSITGKNWKKQTMNTYLTRLQNRGQVRTEASGSRLRYYPALSRDEFYQNYASAIVTETFHGSLSQFVAAFTGKHRISEDERQELLNHLENL